MALSNTVTGDGRLVSYNVAKQPISIDVQRSNGSVRRYNYEDTITETVNEWVALTKSAAEGGADSMVDAMNKTATASIDDPIIGSYKLTVTTITRERSYLGSEIVTPAE